MNFRRRKKPQTDGFRRAQYGFQHGMHYRERLRSCSDMWSRSDAPAQTESVPMALRMLAADEREPSMCYLRLKLPLRFIGGVVCSLRDRSTDGANFLAFTSSPSQPSDLAARFLLCPPDLGGVCDVWPTALDIHLETVKCPEAAAPFVGSLLQTVVKHHLEEQQRENNPPQAGLPEALSVKLHGLHSMATPKGVAYYTGWTLSGNRQKLWMRILAIVEDFRNQVNSLNAEVVRRDLFSLESARRREPLWSKIVLRRFTGDLTDQQEAARRELNVTGMPACGLAVSSLRLEFSQWLYEAEPGRPDCCRRKVVRDEDGCPCDVQITSDAYS